MKNLNLSFLAISFETWDFAAVWKHKMRLKLSKFSEHGDISIWGLYQKDNIWYIFLLHRVNLNSYNLNTADFVGNVAGMFEMPKIRYWCIETIGNSDIFPQRKIAVFKEDTRKGRAFNNPFPRNPIIAGQIQQIMKVVT